MNNNKIPSLKSGDGLPARVVVICDGRTSLRLSQEMNGFDNLIHYEQNSWFEFKQVLNHHDCAMKWFIDGKQHNFDWMTVYPFGYENWVIQDETTVKCKSIVVMNSISWSFDGVTEFAEFNIPAEMFSECNNADKQGNFLGSTKWEYPTDNNNSTDFWCAKRDEKWLFRDSSTYAGIAGKTIQSEMCSSALSLCIMASSTLQITKTEDSWLFRVSAKNGKATLVIGLADNKETAILKARKALENNDNNWKSQIERYSIINSDTPKINFGRHTALRHFFALQPGYLESMRLRENPGAFRANNDYYWVWGWDMTRPAFGVLNSNRWDFVKSLLDFINNAGYINQYDNTLTRDLRVDGGKPGALEYMLAHDYLAWSGDVESTRAWQKKFEDALSDEILNPDPTGMHSGAAASTDFPEEFGRTFPARLTYSMSWHYVGLLSAEKLLLAWGNAELAKKIRNQALKIKRNFTRVFWNNATGFWNEGVHAENPDLICDIPLSTAMAAMESPYGEDLYGEKLEESADFCDKHFLRDDGVYITARGEKRGWKEWTRQPNNWFAANDTMLARLFRTTGNIRALDKLFYLYEINFGYQPCAFEGKPLFRPLNTSGSWQAFGAGAWYRNLVECAAGLWADMGGLGLMPSGLGEPVELTGLQYRNAVINFKSTGQGIWPNKLLIDGKLLIGTTKFPKLTDGTHTITVEYGSSDPPHPILLLAADAEIINTEIIREKLIIELSGNGYTPISFFSPDYPVIKLNDTNLTFEWNSTTGRGRTRCLLTGRSRLEICG